MNELDIAKELKAAVDDGRIPDSSRPRWRAILASRGEDARTELRSLASVTAIVAAAGSTTNGSRRQEHLMQPKLKVKADATAQQGARSGALAISREQMQTLAVKLGLAATTSTPEIVAEVNNAPIADDQLERIKKRDGLIEEGVASGAIKESEREQWVAVYNAGPRIAQHALGERMAAVQKPKPAPVKPAPKRTPVAASAGVPHTGVVTDPVSGDLAWNGLPVTPGADGTPLVHTTNGAMSIGEFQSAGLDAGTERVAVGLARMTGSAKADLPKRSSLFGGS